MSRTGRKVISLPEKVKVSVKKEAIEVEGPLGKLSQSIPPQIQIQAGDRELQITRENDEPNVRSLHGLTRALVANMVQGVSQGFKKELDILGVGYKADSRGSDVVFNLGFSHQVEFAVPAGVKVQVEKNTHLVITGSDKALVGQVAADIRELKPPEPYKGKGIRYSDEVVRRKAGKSAGGK